MRRPASCGVALAAAAVLLGCGIQPMPRVAANGSTITILVPNGFGAGFGRVLNQWVATQPVGSLNPATATLAIQDPPTLEDFQHGEILFALRLTSDPTSGLVGYLPVRYITRVEVD